MALRTKLNGMRKLFFILSLFWVFAANAQHIQVEECTEKDFHIGAPDPCNMAGDGVPNVAWWVQLAVYKDPPIPPAGVQVAKFGEYYFYYANVNYTEEQARMAATMLRTQGFCGAFPVKNPFGIVFFTEKEITKYAEYRP
jgi:hypothetical protein